MKARRINTAPTMNIQEKWAWKSGQKGREGGCGERLYVHVQVYMTQFSLYVYVNHNLWTGQ